MKKKSKAKPELDMSRYDWSKASRGRFAERFAGTSRQPPIAVRILDDDLIATFPDSESVNRALHAMVDAAKKVLKREKRRAA